jgi:predicted transposase/invertase (TIGR01784 family)
MGQMDLGYKELFSNKEMVRDLLTGFVKEEWIDELDFSRMDRVSGTYISDDLRERQDDMIWRIGFRDRWLYVYIMLEFQSTVDRWMGVRLLTYIGLLYQDLIKTGAIDKDEGLPPVLPLVLYSGKRRWNAPVSLKELFPEIPLGLETYQPNLRYFLMDEGQYDDSKLQIPKNLVAALLRMENSRSHQDLRVVIRELIDWLQMPEHTKIRRSFTVFLRGVLLPRRIPDRDFSAYSDLLEVDTMLAEKVRDWTKAWEKEGLRKGIHRGRREGMEKGIEKGMDLEPISELTGLDIDKVRDMSQNPDRYRAETDG